MRKLKNTNFNDIPVRNAVIKFFKDHFNVLLEHTPHHKYLIDLTGVTNTNLGVEVEGGKWKGDFWGNESYSRISGLPFATVNIPFRKNKYWTEEYTFYRKLKQNPSYNENIFVRSNKMFTQMIVIRPQTIRDETKVIKTRFQPNNSNEEEDWLSFRREHVETYNLEDGSWILDKSYELQ